VELFRQDLRSALLFGRIRTMKEFMMAGLLLCALLLGGSIGGCANHRTTLTTEVKMQAERPDNPELSVKYTITMP
jgi:hypothetical protein